MKRFLGWLLASFILVLASSYAWTLRRHVVEVVAARGDSAAPVQVQTLPNYAEVRQAQEMVTVTGPMADYMLRQKSSHVETLQPVSHRATTSNPVSRSRRFRVEPLPPTTLADRRWVPAAPSCTKFLRLPTS
jgi:hypothetical protein